MGAYWAEKKNNNKLSIKTYSFIFELCRIV